MISLHSAGRRALVACAFACSVAPGIRADTCTAPPAGLVAWWRAEGNGADTRGQTPATNDGATFAAGEVGQAFQLGAAKAGLALGTAPWLQREDFTVEAWVRRSSASAASSAGGDRGWILAFGQGGWGVGLLNDGRLVLSRVGEADVASPAPAVADTALHHVAVARREGTVAFYVDGLPAGTGALNERFRFAAPAAIGRRGDDKSGSFAGAIDELSVFDRALSDAEVAAVFGTKTAGKCLPAADVPDDVAVATERWVHGSAANGNQFVTSDGFAVFGRLRLESSDGGYVSSIDVGSGDLVVAAGGEFVSNVGTGGPRYLRGNLLNRGTATVAYDLVLDRPGTITRNEGALALAGGSMLFRGGGQLVELLPGGTVTGPGILDVDSGGLRFLGGTVSTPILLLNSTLEIGPGNTNAADIVVGGNGGRVRGDIAPAQSVTIRGGVRGQHANVGAPLGFANSGTLQLTSQDGGYAATLALGSGVLTNRAGALLATQPGAGGQRTVSGALVNEGTLQVNYPTTLVWPGATHVNRGTVAIAPGMTLYLSGNGQTFRQEAGSLQGGGAFDLSGVRFEYLGGDVPGPLDLFHSDFVLGPNATGPGPFALVGNDSTFAGDVKPGQTLWIRGDGRGGHTTLTVPPFVNRGTVLLQSRDGGYAASLVFTGGTLTNETGAQLVVGAGSGGPRFLGVQLLNRGTVTVGYPATLATANATHVNRGSIDVQAGDSLAISGQGQTLRLESGNLNIAGSVDLSGIGLVWLGGTITGVPYLDGVELTLGDAATSPVFLPLTRGGTVVHGTIKPGQELLVRGNGRGGHTTVSFPEGFENHGIVRLRSEDGGYLSAINATAHGIHNASDGQLRVEAGTGGPRTLSGAVLNEGLLAFDWPGTILQPGATHVNRGEFRVPAGSAFSMSGNGQVLRHESGAMHLDGAVDFSGFVLDWQGGTLTGSPGLDGMDVRVAPSVTQPFSFGLTRSGSSYTGELKAGQSLWIRGDGRGGHTTALLSDTFSVAGTLLLESRDGGYLSGVRVGSGPLTVQPGGLLRSGVGTGGPRVMDAPLLNRGRVEAAWPLTLGHDGLVHRNEADFVVPAGSAVGMAGAGSVFEQAGGTLALDGSFAVRGQKFRYLGGLTKGLVYLVGSTLEFGPGAGPTGTFLASGGNTVSGAVPAGATLIAQGASEGGNTVVSAPAGLVVGGTLQVASRDGGYLSAVDVTGGPLVIGPSGLLQVQPGTGGPRWVAGEIRNSGRIEVTWPVTLGQASGPVLSSGGVRVGAGATLSLPGGMQMTGGRLDGTGSVAGTVQGDGTVAPGPGIGVLSVNGAYKQGPQGVLEIEVGGTAPGTAHDQLVTTVPAQLSGTVRVVFANGFVPAEGNQFQVISGPPVALAGGRLELPALPAGLSWNTSVNGGLLLSVAASKASDAQFAGRVADADGHPVAGVVVGAVQSVSGGVLAQYWNNAGLSGDPALTRIDPLVDNDWGGGSPDPAIGADNFSVRWTGFVVPRYSETYTFHTISDDGVRLWVNDTPIIDNWGDHAPTENVGTIDLVAGRPYALRMEMYEHGGGAVARLRWSSASQALEAVPTVALRPASGTGLVVGAEVVAAVTGADGRYALPVHGGDWTLDVGGLVPLGFDPVVPVAITANGATQTVNFTVSPLTLPRHPDLVADAPAFASPGVGGQPLPVTWTTRNTGETKASGPWVETILMNRDPFPYGAQEVARATFPDTIAPGAAAARQATFVPPVGLTGRVYLFVRVDTTLQVDEGDGEGNNVSPGTPLDLIIGDLVVDSVSAPATLAYGDAADVTYVVRNAGGATVPGGWTDAVRFGPGTDGGATLASVAVPAGLAPGERYTNVVRVVVPLNGQNTPGTFHFVVATDASSQRPEASEANNAGASADVNLTRPDPADLAVTAVSVPLTVPAGQPVALVWAVANPGKTRAVAPWREAVAVTLPDGTAPVALASLVVAAPLDAGATVTRTQQVIFPASLAGARKLAVTTDADDAVFEAGDGSNNTFLTASPFVVTAPDLVVDAVSVQPGVFGKALSVQWTVRNRGNGAAVGSWGDSLVLAGPGGTVTLPAVPRPGSAPLAPGATYTQTASPVVPLGGSAKAGDYILTVAADAAGEVGESDESNNSRAGAAFRIDVPPLPDLAVLSVKAPAIASPGASVPLVYVVTNRGKADATGPWIDTVSVASTADPASLRRLANIDRTNVLAAGASATWTNPVVIPQDFSGDVRFAVAADASSQVNESDESNNLGTSDPATRVPLQLLLALPSDSVAEDVSPAVFTARVSRSGPVGAALSVAVTSSSPAVLAPPATVQIPAGQAGVDVPFAVTRNPAVTGPVVVTLGVSADGLEGESAAVTVTDADVPSLSLSPSQTTIAEGGSIPVTVTRSGPLGAAIKVVVSAGTTDLLPPATVTIPAGQASATFALLATDNDRLDGPRPSAISASSPGMGGDTAALTVLDNDDPGLVVTVDPGSVGEGDGGLAATGTVTRAAATSRPLKVQLSVGGSTSLYVPATVVIPANARSAAFQVAAIDDHVVNGTRVVTVAGSVVDSQTGATLATAVPAKVEVRDDDGPALRLSLGTTIAREGRSPAFTAVVFRNTDTNVDLVVALASSDAREATVPATVTIPKGQQGAAFPVATVDDGVVDGNKPVTLEATAAGHAKASAALTVTDAQLPDLAVTEVRAPDSGATGDLATFGYKVRNQGFAGFTNTFVQRVYLSADAILDANDLLLDETPFTGAMQPGDSFDRSVTRRLPLQAGTYRVIVVTDAEDAVTEALENNNVAVSPNVVTVSAAYTATVETSLTVAPSGTPVPLTGSAKRVNGTPAASEIVSIHVRVQGTERVIAALTDGSGKFSTTFNPVPGEYGQYEIGACHPGVPAAPTQDTFELLGMKAGPVNQFTLVVPGKTNRLKVDLTNVNARALTALSADVQASSGLGFAVRPPTDLAPGATGAATIDVWSTDERDATGVFTVLFKSAEGAQARVGVQYNVELPSPRLVATPASLEVGVVRGKQAVVEVQLSNTGGADSGPVDLTLPDLPWLRPATPAPYPSLAPGETRKLTFLLTPDATVPLQVFEGRFAVGNDQARVAVPFVFRHVSDASGDVRVLAEDELTYYGTNAVRVANAAVALSDVYSGATLYSGMTGPDGTLRLPGVREGTYNLEVSAPKHDSYKRTVEVGAGKTSEFTAFLRTQLVRYNWKVEEIDVEEHATIKLETVFETTVPVPVITIEPSSIDLTHVEGEEYQVDLKITNQGLIAAQDVKLGIEGGATWAVRTLADDIGVLPAKSTLTIPVVFTRIHEGASGKAVAGRRAAAPAGILDRCTKPSIGVAWQLVCGQFGVAYYAPVAVIDLGLCPPLTSVTVSRDPLGWLDPLVPIVNLFPGNVTGSPGGIGDPFTVGVGTRGYTSYAGTNDCSCVKSGFQEKCVAAEGGIKGEARGAVLGAINAALPTYAKLLSFETKFNGAVKMCTCCTDVDGQTVLGLKMEGEVGGEIEGKVLFGVSASTELDVNIAGFSEAKAEVKGQLGLEAALNGSVKAKASTECLLTNPKFCVEAKFTAKGFLGGKGSAEISAKAPGETEAKKIGSAEIAVGVESGLSASVEGCSDTGFKAKACTEPVVFKAEGEVGVAVGEDTRFVKVGGSTELYPAVCNPPSNASADAFVYNPHAGLSEGALVARLMDARSPSDLVRQVSGKAASVGAGASGRELSDALVKSLGARRTRLPGAAPEVVFEQVLRSDKASAEEKSRMADARRTARRAAGSDGICAQVKLLIEQQAVVTRKAIGATLEVVNESTDTPLEDLGVTVQVFDRQGNLANDKFVILDPELTRFQPMDAPPTNRYLLGGLALSLPADTTGSARWTILPTDDAAPDAVTDYYVGGFMTYRVGNVVKTAEFTPGPVRVYPNAKLRLKYFHQRDVFSDDPFTPEVEPSVPFVLGVMVVNEGKGLARNVSITSAQPKIVENVKGLLINFDIVATEVAGKPLAPTLTADFGDIGPGSIGIGRWLLKSSLQGLFVDYQATLVHDDRFGERGASVFAGVEIHEMIHQVEADRSDADGLPDFLANDVSDPPEDLPDTLYLSDGRIEKVSAVRTATSDGPPTSGNLEVRLAAPMPRGWAYLRVPDPAAGQFTLAKVLRPDGSEVSVNTNAWVTDRTFVGMGRRPIREYTLHLLDKDSAGTYRLIYRRDESVPDTTAPSSQVAALPATAPALIPVRWSGQDDAQGSGIASFDVFVSVDGGPFARWRAGTRDNSAFYAGAAGHRYAFYSVAKDAAGNVEPAPGVPDATTVAAGNSAPSLDPVADQSLDEGGRVDLTLRATDQDLPGDTLTYRLVQGPAGMVVDGATGRLTWQTGEADGPGSPLIVVSVTDSGTPPLTAQQSFRVTVREVNSPVRLVLPATQFAVAEGNLLRFVASADDADLPANPFRYRLTGAVPPGATINAVTGEFRWVPSEAQGGASYTFGVEVNDQGTPATTDAATVRVAVSKVNSAPVVMAIANQVVHEGDPIDLLVKAVDNDLPPQGLAYTLGAGTPATVKLDAATGRLTWVPGEADVAGPNVVTVVVTDDDASPLSASTSFRVTVKPLHLGLNLPDRTGSGDVSFRFKGAQGGKYVLDGSVDLTTWVPLQDFTADVPIFTLVDHSSAGFPWRYFRVRVKP